MWSRKSKMKLYDRQMVLGQLLELYKNEMRYQLLILCTLILLLCWILKWRLCDEYGDGDDLRNRLRTWKGIFLKRWWNLHNAKIIYIINKHLNLILEIILSMRLLQLDLDITFEEYSSELFGRIPRLLRLRLLFELMTCMQLPRQTIQREERKNVFETMKLVLKQICQSSRHIVNYAWFLNVWNTFILLANGEVNNNQKVWELSTSAPKGEDRNELTTTS